MTLLRQMIHLCCASTHSVAEPWTSGPLLTLPHPAYLVRRFLRARNFDLAKTKAMYTNTARWKKEFGVDELYHTFEYTEKAQVDKYYPRLVANPK